MELIVTYFKLSEILILRQQITKEARYVCIALNILHNISSLSSHHNSDSGLSSSRFLSKDRHMTGCFTCICHSRVSD